MAVETTDGKHSPQTRATGTIDERDTLTGVRGYYTLLRDFDFEAHANDCVYVTLCDIDDFRLLNDAYGENRCNDVLARIGQTMRSVFEDDHVFRYGSDEFLIVKAADSKQEFAAALTELDKRIAAIDINGDPLLITCSYGCICGHIKDSDALHEAVRLADRKMYEAKRMGKGRVVFGDLDADPILLDGHRHSRSQRIYETDELTGLSNLVFFRNRLAELLQAQRDNPPAQPAERKCLVYFNIQNFKVYNQQFGFDKGDALLVLVADAICGAFPDCLASRFAADQFMVVTTEARAKEGFYAVRNAFRTQHKDTSIWLRAGFYTPSDDDDDTVLNMDRAKMACDSIRGRRDKFFAEYDDELRAQILMHRHVLDDFDKALEEGWVKPFYQPIVRVATGEVCDLEALARWIDPERGIVSPAEFIPVLEDARLIDKLDLHIIRCACRDYAASRAGKRNFVSLSINLSRLDFELCDIVEEITQIADEFEVPHEDLAIEVTESTLAGNVEFLKGEIDRFRERGFEVWMDDFGSGYSSLNLLKEYNFDMLKVDMGFLREFEKNEPVRIILSHIISMAKELGIKTLVEGVETPEQYAFLKSIGCGRAQGWHFARPMDIDTIRKDVDEGMFAQVETHVLAQFYEDVGRINMIRPNPTNPIGGHYVPGDVAAVVVERVKGVWRFLNVSDTYMRLLAQYGLAEQDIIDGVTHSDNPFYVRLRESIEQAVESGQWERENYHDLGLDWSLNIKLVARSDEQDAIGIIVVTGV